MTSSSINGLEDITPTLVRHGFVNIQKTNERSVTVPLPERTWTMLPPHADAPDNEFVYFMYSAGRIKIGYSRGTAGRHKQLSSSGPLPPVILLIMHGRMEDEQALHIQFLDDRLHGEWFLLSENLRAYLRRRLCDRGRDSLEQAEAEFRDYCEAFLAGYKVPPRHKPRPHCTHGMPVGAICAPCERERDLKILDDLRSKGSTA